MFTSLLSRNARKRQKEKAEKESGDDSSEGNRVFNAFVSVSSRVVFRPVAPVVIKNADNGKSRKALVILDNGSNTSCVACQLADELVVF